MKKIISYLLILTMAMSLIVALPTLTVSAESLYPECVAPTATNGGGECHAPVIEETEEYPAVKHGGNYIYDLEDIYYLFRSSYNKDANGNIISNTEFYPYGLGGEGNFETYIFQNDITIDENYWGTSGSLTGLGGNLSYATIDGKNTEGRICTIHFDNAKCLFGWGRDVTVRNLIMDGYSIYDKEDYTQHVGPLYMHGIDYDCTLENITSRLDIRVEKLGKHPTVEQKIGGVIAKFDGNLDDYLTNVVFEGSITVGTPENHVPLYGALGGIAGTSTADTGYTFHMTECHNKGNITINGDTNGKVVGGLIGLAVSNVEATNCSNSGNLTFAEDYSGSHIGGLIGSGYYIKGPVSGSTASWNILNCHNTGNIALNGDWKTDIQNGEEIIVTETVEGDTVNSYISGVSVGGLFGQITAYNETPGTVKISKCSNEGNIVNKYGKAVQIGGIIGVSTRINLTIEYCTNGVMGSTAYGAITSRNVVYTGDSGSHTGIGGIAGNLSNPGSTYYKWDGTKQADGTYNYTATVDYTDKTININNCANYGPITVSEKSATISGGGMVGRFNASPSVSISRCLNHAVIDLSKAAGWSGAAGIVGSYMTVAMPVWVYNYPDATVDRHDENGNVVYSDVQETDKEGNPVFNEDDTPKMVPIKDPGRFNFSWSSLDKGTLTITNCYNMSTGTIKGGTHAGGILGAGQQLLDNDIKLSFSYCTNEAPITGAQSAGGIVGCVGEFRETTHEQFGYLDFNYCVNKAAITVPTGLTATWYAAGGILGRTEGDSDSDIRTSGLVLDTNNKANERTSFANCANTAVIYMNQTTEAYIGEAAGYVGNYTILNTTDVSGNRNKNGTLLGGANDNPGGSRWIGTGYNEGTGNHNDYTQYGSSYFATAQAKTGLIKNETDFYNAFKESNGATGAYYIVNDFTLTTQFADGSNATKITNGVLYGNGHTITFNGGHHLFNSLGGGNGCAVYDLNFVGTINSGRSHVSPLAWHGSGNKIILSNIRSSVTINYTGTGACGGVLSKIDNSYEQLICEDVIFDGKINYNSALSYTGYACCGGIIGHAFGGGLLVNTQTAPGASITITGGAGNAERAGVGGLLGNVTSEYEIRDCVNNATISINDGTNLYVGGLVGSGIRGLDNTGSQIYIYNSHNKASTINGGAYVGGLVGGFGAQSTNSTSSTMSIEAVSSTNSADLTGTTVVGGLIATTAASDATVRLHTKCANVGDVQATAGVAGGIIGEVKTVDLLNVANTGNVSGTTRAGGLIGSSTVSATLLNCVNRGDVEADNYAGGIISNAAGVVDVEKCANGGAVTSKSTSASPATAAGIVAYIGTATSAIIDRCANSGAVSVLATASSATDTAVTAAGILGITDSAATVNNCIHMGSVITGGSSSSNSAYPISNPSSGKVTTIAARTLGNVYRVGTVNEENAANFTLSNSATGTQIKQQLDTDKLWAFDMDSLQEQREYAIDIRDNDGLYTGVSLTTLNTELADSNKTVTADWSDPNNWVYQTDVNIAEDQLIAAMTSVNNSNASYIVYIPPVINPGETETDITVSTSGFNALSLFTLTFTSDLQLDNVDTPADKLTYRIDINETETPSGTEILRYEGRNPAQQEYKLKATLTPQANENVYVAGVYKDTVGFIINYSEVPKDSYTD